MRVREKMARVRRRCDPFYKAKWARIRREQIAANAPYENGEEGYWHPAVMGLEETMEYITGHRASIARFGDGEMALVCGREMLFEPANELIQARLVKVLQDPSPDCLVAIPDIFGNLSAYKERDHAFWREVALWSRERMYAAMNEGYKTSPPRLLLGNPYISRPYMNLADPSAAQNVFGAWKALFDSKNILIVEGRFSRFGIGNDLLDGAKSIRRIWCPPRFAFARYDEIHSVVKHEAKQDDLVILALGATATILAYDLSKEGYWAIDTGHLDVEYMWMKMGATEKVAIPGRYVSEVTGAQEQKPEDGEERRYNVVAKIGC